MANMAGAPRKNPVEVRFPSATGFVLADFQEARLPKTKIWGEKNQDF